MLDARWRVEGLGDGERGVQIGDRGAGGELAGPGGGEEVRS